MNLSKHKNYSVKPVRRILFAAVVLSVLISSMLPARVLKAQGEQLPYRNPGLSIDERVKDLLGRMTLEEKAAQMTCLWMEKPNDNAGVPKDQLPFGGRFSPELAKQKMPHGIGQFARQREAGIKPKSFNFAASGSRSILRRGRPAATCGLSLGTGRATKTLWLRA